MGGQLMLATGHRIVAANIVLAIPMDSAEKALMLAGAVLFSAGRFSPDLDAREPARTIFGHRGILHWWGLPAIAAVALCIAGAPIYLYGPVIGWGSHIFPADYVFGKAGYGTGEGVPLWPYKDSPRLGLGFKVSGRFVGHSGPELTATIVLGTVLFFQAVYFLMTLKG